MMDYHSLTRRYGPKDISSVKGARMTDERESDETPNSVVEIGSTEAGFATAGE